MGQEAEAPSAGAGFAPFQVNEALMQRHARDAVVHALPAGASRRGGY